MYIHGEFKNSNNKTFSVHILKGDKSEEMIIGENGLFFSSDPLTINTTCDDTFTHIIKKSCTLTLLTDTYLGTYLFAEKEKDVVINIYEGNKCIFAGYVEPNIYTQPYANHYEEIQINCLDYLGTLQYCYLTDGTTYEEVVSNADIRSFYYFINKAGLIGTELDIVGNTTTKTYYDYSKKYTLPNVFKEAYISENVFLGESEDDLMNNEEILFEILQYLNLHIIQEGFDFYIFDWKSKKSLDSIRWMDINTELVTQKSVTLINVDKDDYSSDGTNISIADVYNQIQVKDDITEVEDIIVSPLNNDSLTSLFPSKIKYMTEFISEGSGDTARDAMNDMVRGRGTTYKNASSVDWFMQVMENKNWKFYIDNGQTELSTIYEKDAEGNYINEWKVTKYLKEHPLTPAIFSLGSVEKKDSTDNSPVSKIDLSNYLYISVNGNEIDTEGSQQPSDTVIQSHTGMIEYVGNNVSVLSPVDDETTNYLVFSGSIRLQPIVYESSSTLASRTNNFTDIYNNGCHKSEGSKANVPSYNGGIVTNNLVKSDNNEEGRYYTRKFYTPTNTKEEPTTFLTDGTCGVQPWTKDKAAKGYQYNYTYNGESTDKYSKLPLLECELIIGNKRLVETNIDEYGNSTFEWFTLGQEPIIDGVQKTTFSLGINPKITDYIIGTEYNIQNTISYTMNLDGAEGTAIPIKASDNLSGKITFRILGTVNLTWNNITRRHGTFWRHQSFPSSTRFILAHTENIIIKDFECKVYSDNAGNTAVEDGDIIYMSAETDNFIKKKDDIEFKINTALTSQEAFNLQAKNIINLSSVLGEDRTALRDLKDNITNETAKPEQHYCNDYYLEYSQPKIILETDLKDTVNISYFNRYYIPYMNKVFYPLVIDKNIIEDSTHLILKEI